MYDSVKTILAKSQGYVMVMIVLCFQNILFLETYV